MSDIFYIVTTDYSTIVVGLLTALTDHSYVATDYSAIATSYLTVPTDYSHVAIDDVVIDVWSAAQSIYFSQ